MEKTYGENKNAKIVILIILCCFPIFNLYSQKSHPESLLKDSLLAVELNKKGIDMGRRGDLEEAIKIFTEVYNIKLKLNGPNSITLVSPLNSLGIQYKNLQNFEDAINVYKEAEKLYVAKFGRDYPLLGIIYSNLGNIYSSTGDYNQALEYHRNALRVMKKDSTKFSIPYNDLKYNIAEVQLKLGYNTEAIKFAQSNLKIVVPRLKPRLYDLIALAYLKEGSYELSGKNYLAAIDCWKELYGESNVELASEYLAYSSLLISQRKFDRALIYTAKAKEIILKLYGEKKSEFAEVQSNFGDYYYMKNSEALQIDDFRAPRKKNLKDAIQYYHNAICALVDSFNVKDPFVDPPLQNVISEIQLVDKFKKKAIAMEELADIYRSEFNYTNSFRYYSASLNALGKATQLIHQLQIGFESEDSKYFLTQNQESTFADAIKIAFKLYTQTKKQEYVDKAFEFSERSKSSNLLASVKDVKAMEFGDIPDSLLKKENNLKRDIASYTSLLFEENHAEKPDSQKVNMYSSKIFKFNEEYNKLIDSFEKSYPRYYALKYENKVIGIKEIQLNLNARQALVEYFIKEPDGPKLEGQIYRFVITKDSASFSMENIDYSFVNNIQSIHDFLISPNYLFTKKKDFLNYVSAGYGLYEKLLKPLAQKINGKDLTIIPHDKLSYIPFDALLSQFPDTITMNFRNLDYLVRDYTINYSYSATLLYDYFDQKKTNEKSLLVFSPQYIADDPRVDPETSVRHFLSPLPGAADEVKGISRYVKADAFEGIFAQENIFKEKASDFNILHLAMHTIINDSLPMFSKLVFSKPDSKSTDDGYLNTHEIYNMKLNAHLAVLSACETGTGKLQKGEGVMSMARGFIFAGCPSIVMTLWQVEDQSGAKIMEDFYYYLSKGKRKDVALRMAKLKHLETSDPLTAHPHYWLGYVNIGNPEPLFTSKDIYFVILLIVAIALVFTDWYHRKRPRKNSRS